MKGSKHILRKVPKNFHDLSVSTLPSSVDTIYEDGYKKGTVDHMAIVSRNGEILWDITSKEKPSDVYNACLNENVERTYNNLYKAHKGNQREFVGLMKDKEKLQQLKETIIVMSPLLNVSTKTK